jgi:hypothetical protein
MQLVTIDCIVDDFLTDKHVTVTCSTILISIAQYYKEESRHENRIDTYMHFKIYAHCYQQKIQNLIQYVRVIRRIK